jgi:hypothetical protein
MKRYERKRKKNYLDDGRRDKHCCKLQVVKKTLGIAFSCLHNAIKFAAKLYRVKKMRIHE